MLSFAFSKNVVTVYNFLVLAVRVCIILVVLLKMENHFVPSYHVCPQVYISIIKGKKKVLIDCSYYTVTSVFFGFLIAVCVLTLWFAPMVRVA